MELIFQCSVRTLQISAARHRHSNSPKSALTYELEANSLLPGGKVITTWLATHYIMKYSGGMTKFYGAFAYEFIRVLIGMSLFWLRAIHLLLEPEINLCPRVRSVAHQFSGGLNFPIDEWSCSQLVAPLYSQRAAHPLSLNRILKVV